MRKSGQSMSAIADILSTRRGGQFPNLLSGCNGRGSLEVPHSGMATTRIRIREDFPAAPVCPHCGKEIHEIAARRVESVLGVRFLYFCCDCRKVLGVSHRKGFWMG